MERLKALREARGDSQKKIANMLKIDRTTYTKYETGANNPSHDMLIKLADYYSVSVDYLLNRSEPNDRSSEDTEIWELREELRRNPDLNMLLSTARGATKSDIAKTVKILKTLKGDE